MRATKFEFEQRFGIIGAIFSLGFWLYSAPTSRPFRGFWRR